MNYGKAERLQIAHEIIETYRDSKHSLSSCIQARGLPESTFYSWMYKHEDLRNKYADARTMRMAALDQDAQDVFERTYMERASGQTIKTINTLTITGKLANGQMITETADMRNADALTRMLNIVSKLNEVIVQAQTKTQNVPPSDAFIIQSSAGFGETK